jgi:hypothetical protein
MLKLAHQAFSAIPMLKDVQTIMSDLQHLGMGAVSAKGDTAKKSVNNKFFLVACCDSTSVNGPDTMTGIAFLNLSGMSTIPKGSTDNVPQSIKITGSQIKGGGPGGVFKGTFSSLLEPQ